MSHRRSDIKAVENYLAQLDFVSQAGPQVSNETPKQQRERIDEAKKNYKYFFETYFTHYATDETADFQVKAAKKVKANKRIKAVMEWARGLGKSVHFDIGIPLWLYINGDMRFMVLISANFDAAKSLLADLQAEFEANQLLRHDFKIELQHGSWADGDFRLKDGTRFVARGRGQRLRGLRSKAQRPDYIVIDDADDDELSQNPARVRKVIQWIYKAVLGLGDKGNFRVIIVNNRISENSILAHFAAHKRWFHLKVNAIDKNGKPAWYQKYTVEYYREVEEDTNYFSFQTEYMNNPITEGSVFKEKDITWEKIIFTKIKSFDRIIGYWDPAYTGNPTSDFNSIVILGFKGHYIYLIDTFTRQCTPERAIAAMYDFDDLFASYGVKVEWYAERQLINKIIEDALDEVAEQKGRYLNLIRDDRVKGNKQSRITSIAFYFQRNFIIFNKVKKETPDMKAGLALLLAFEIGYRGHDDFPDALEGGIEKGKTGVFTDKTLPKTGKNKKREGAW